MLNSSRIETRVGTGGHGVPFDKIKSRYQRSLDLLRRALAASYRAYLFDNSGTSPAWIAERLPAGTLVTKVDDNDLPAWYLRYAA